MAVYRALNNLSTGTRSGDLTRLEWLTPEQIAKLERIGAVARVSAPPLEVIPEWQTRAESLSMSGITDLEQLIEADAGQIAPSCGITVAEAVQWQKEAAERLVFRRVERI